MPMKYKRDKTKTGIVAIIIWKYDSLRVLRANTYESFE
jgi:hypothetical protein